MQEHKKQLEILIMDYFKASLPDFPKGKVLPSESPDFLVKMKNKHLLGIELTRLNPANASAVDEKDLAEIKRREELIALAKGLYEHSSEVKLFVKFLFSNSSRLSEETQLVWAAKISSLISKAIQHKKTTCFFRISIPKKELPDGLEQLLIVHHPKLEVAIWERSNNLGVSNNVVDDIRRAIHKKDEKIKYYQKQHLNYYWLLITTDRLRGVKNFNLSNKIMSQHFESRFQCVYLFDLVKAKVFQLV